MNDITPLILTFNEAQAPLVWRRVIGYKLIVTRLGDVCQITDNC